MRFFCFIDLSVLPFSLYRIVWALFGPRSPIWIWTWRTKCQWSRSVTGEKLENIFNKYFKFFVSFQFIPSGIEKRRKKLKNGREGSSICTETMTKYSTEKVNAGHVERGPIKASLHPLHRGLMGPTKVYCFYFFTPIRSALLSLSSLLWIQKSFESGLFSSFSYFCALQLPRITSGFQIKFQI